MTTSIGGTTGVTFPDASVQNTAAIGFGFKNRIINGAMMIDQRNAGASTNLVGGTYYLDRYRGGASATGKATVAQSSTAPSGFSNSLLVTSSSAYSVGAAETFNIQQRIEGFNFADLGWGAAGASTVTLSFWVRSSLTGTFGGAILNSAQDRSYPFSFTISSANTFEYKSITIAGDTTGTWIGATSGIGAIVCFSLGTGSTYSGTAGAWAAGTYYAPTSATSVVGTNGATFYITGVQLEKGSTATSFDYRPYGTELALCQRYYYRIFPQATNASLSLAGWCNGATSTALTGQFPVTMRIAPTALEQSGTAGNYKVFSSSGSADCSSVPTFYSSIATTKEAFSVAFTVASGLTDGRGAHGITGATTGASAYLGWSAEL